MAQTKQSPDLEPAGVTQDNWAAAMDGVHARLEDWIGQPDADPRARLSPEARAELDGTHEGGRLVGPEVPDLDGV